MDTLQQRNLWDQRIVKPVNVKMGILILGAGGHAKVIADILQAQGIAVAGFLDDDPRTWNTCPLNIPVLGPIALYSEFPDNPLIIGIGSNAARQAIAAELNGRQFLCNAIHPQAIVAPSVRLGIGVVVSAAAIINPDTVIGDHVIINTAAIVEHDCQIDAFAHVGPGTRLAGGVHVGEGTLIGIGAIVIPCKKIGCNSVVGAGAVVVDDVPDNVIVKGVPAR